MSFDQYEENDMLMEAVQSVIKKDEITDTRGLTESELVEHFDKTQVKNTVTSEDVGYGTVINSLIKEINEATDTKLKNTLETLCYILIKEHDETDIVPTPIVERISKISSLGLIKEDSNQLTEDVKN